MGSLLSSFATVDACATITPLTFTLKHFHFSGGAQMAFARTRSARARLGFYTVSAPQ